MHKLHWCHETFVKSEQEQQMNIATVTSGLTRESQFGLAAPVLFFPVLGGLSQLNLSSKLMERPQLTLASELGPKRLSRTIANLLVMADLLSGYLFS